VNARQSDFAFVSAAAQIALDDDGRCLRAAVGIGAAAAIPLRLAAVENVLIGTRGEQALLRPVLIEALAGVEMFTDLHASADYRRRAAVTLALRAIADAWRDAQAGGRHAR
jgi:CO/xanthine dehydrogenase FAD-binding subunit